MSEVDPSLLVDVLKRAGARGATAADGFLIEEQSFSASVRLGNSFRLPLRTSVKLLNNDQAVRSRNSSCLGFRHSLKIAGICLGVQARTSVDRMMRSCTEESEGFLPL